jgi:hypothetical protein
MDSKSHENQRSHPIRLAVLMLLGAAIGESIGPCVTNAAVIDWHLWGPLIGGSLGALAGLLIELFLRSEGSALSSFAKERRRRFR